MKIKLTSIYVNDQEKALHFYTEVLGFVKKADFSQGPFRWLTVASAGARPHETAGGGVHHAANQGDRLDHRQAERHVRQSDPDRHPRPLAELINANEQIWNLL